MAESGIDPVNRTANSRRSSRSISESDIKLLWSNSAGFCNFPGCTTRCTVPATEYDRMNPSIGRMAHIIASSDDGPRGNPNFPLTDRDKYENLILLCSNHHDVVDSQPNTYTATVLIQWKIAKEAWVTSTLQYSMARIGFAELETICHHLLAGPVPPDADLRLTDPGTKMERNGLTNKVRMLIDMGMARSNVVQSYIMSRVEYDDDFPERLKAGFLAEYYRLFQLGERGDILFESLRRFANAGSMEFHRSAAGLAVLCYLFQTCELFER